MVLKGLSELAAEFEWSSVMLQAKVCMDKSDQCQKGQTVTHENSLRCATVLCWSFEHSLNVIKADKI